MVKSLEYAAKKWERKTAGKGDKWKSGVTGAESSYCSNFGAFLGHSVSEACTAYKSGVDAVSAADFNNSIAGKGAKYRSKLGSVK